MQAVPGEEAAADPKQVTRNAPAVPACFIHLLQCTNTNNDGWQPYSQTVFHPKAAAIVS